MNSLRALRPHLAFCLPLLVFGGGCVTIEVDYSGSGRQHVQHVVLCWLKNPSDHETRDAILRVSESFKRIPGVVDVHVGTALPSTRSIVDDSFDIGIVVVCRSPAALQRYLEHPRHTQAAHELIRPAARRILVYDIVE